MWKERLAFYDKLIATNPNFDRKGKTMPYTSVNGHMFSQLNKAGEIGIRLSKQQGALFMQEHQTTVFKSYGAVMKEYVLVPEKLMEDFELLSSYLHDSYTYAKSLKPKSTKQ
ncbi:hypothetical protein [Aquimarina megaterium]|uniref:hypothetical protein n=1 Tax=Aquimarina megaterium TaxID=1443666 RepID=UPI000943D658|nr:hypothetical protein [Aquimarina megaterium]